MSKRAGRRSRDGRMPATAITASVDEFILFMLMGDGTLSEGVRNMAQRLVSSDADAAAQMEKALWMRGRAEAALRAEGNDAPSQKDIYLYVTGNYWAMVEAFAANRPVE